MPSLIEFVLCFNSAEAIEFEKSREVLSTITAAEKIAIEKGISLGALLSADLQKPKAQNATVDYKDLVNNIVDLLLGSEWVNNDSSRGGRINDSNNW